MKTKMRPHRLKNHFVLWLTWMVKADCAQPVPQADSSAKNEAPPVLSPDDEFWQQSIVYTTLAGRHVSPFLRRFFLSREELERLFLYLRSKVHFEDMFLMAAVGWLLVPFLRFVYNVPIGQIEFRSTRNSNAEDITELKHDGKGNVAPRSLSYSRSSSSFNSTPLYLVSDQVQQVAKIALIVYFVDVFRILAVGLGFNIWQMQKIPHAFAQLAYTIWFAQRLAVGKKNVLRSYVSVHPETYGRVRVADRLINATIIAATGVLVLNILKIQMGVALNSFLAIGSVGTLALGLASQGIATQILNGLMLASSDRIYEGDVVKFGGGLSGTIVQMGWLETIIRGSDEVTVSVPHTDLVKQQVSNLSRVRYSQVHQTLRFRLSDAEKLPDAIESIKEEIAKDCPTLITDGTRPFRIYWSNYRSDHLEVTVDAHFRLKILSDEYYDNRQTVLMAIRER